MISTKEKQSAAMRRRWQDPAYRKRMSSLGKKQWTAAYRKKMTALLRSPEVYRHRRHACQRRWKIDTAYRTKMMTVLRQNRERVRRRTGPTKFELKVFHALPWKAELHKQIGPYEVDIYVPRKNLIVECDSTYFHSYPKVKRQDRKRDRYFHKLGLTVFRVIDSEFKQNPLEVIRSIRKALQ